MGGLCPSRNQAASKAYEGAGKVARNYPTPLVKNYPTPLVKKTADKAASSSPVALPTKSWRALLEDAQLNSDAMPFQAKGHTAPNQPESKKAPSRLATPPGLPKLSGNDAEGGAVSKFMPTTRNINESPTLGSAGNGGMTIQTETYMKLLKEGGAKKKPLGPGSSSHNKDAGIGAANHRPLTSHGTGFEQSIAYHVHRGSPPMTIAALKHTWHNALKASAEQEEQAPKANTPQDDIEVERMNADQDLSELAYWSETESTFIRGNASSHRLGRRQVQTTIRSYVMQDLSFELDKAVGVLLSRLQRFSQQPQEFAKEGSTPRRFVIGLKEVARRAKKIKVSCVIVAPDLESDPTEGGLDDRMREVLATSYEKNIPVIFALSRARLGHALGKNMTISLLGVLDTTGANDLFKSAVELAGEARRAWLARLPAK